LADQALGDQAVGDSVHPAIEEEDRSEGMVSFLLFCLPGRET
jgi:hypothetical protein